MNLLKDKISRLERLEELSSDLGKAIDWFNDNPKQLAEGDVFVRNPAGSGRLKFNLATLFNSREILAGIKAAKEQADNNIEAIRPVLEMAEMAFKGMEK